MARLKNINSGAVVSCSDETASRMGSEWEPVKSDSQPKAPAKKAASSKSAAKSNE